MKFIEAIKFLKQENCIGITPYHDIWELSNRKTIIPHITVNESGKFKIKHLSETHFDDFGNRLHDGRETKLENFPKHMRKSEKWGVIIKDKETKKIKVIHEENDKEFLKEITKRS